MRTRYTILAVLLAAVLSVFAMLPACAGYETIVETFTLDSGTSETYVDIPFNGCIREVYLWCPTLDSGDTATLAMTMLPDASATTATVVPNGWSDKAIGATADNALVKCLSSAGTIYVTRMVRFTAYTATNQAADRTFRLIIIREY